MGANGDDKTTMKTQAALMEMPEKIDSVKCENKSVMKNGKRVSCTVIRKAKHGLLHGFLSFHKNLRKDLSSIHVIHAQFSE